MMTFLREGQSQPDSGHLRTRFFLGLHLFPTPLHPSYPERRHRGQVHFRGAGYYLVSRQDTYREQSFSTVDHGPIMQSINEIQQQL